MRLSKSVTIGGRTISGAIERDAVTELSARPTTALAAGKAGTLSTRTDDNTGTATLASGHGILTGDVVDVYWSTGIRRGMTVGTVSGTSVPIDLGAGDNLPAQATAIVVCKVTTLDVDLTGNSIIMAVATATRRASVSIQQNDGTVIKALDLGRSGNDGEVWDWASDTDVTNPFAGVSVGKVVISNGSSAGTNTVSVGFGLNNAA
jgi:hypothetical protein